MLSKYGKGLTRGVALNNHSTTLPMKKGLSSSAAVCVLVTLPTTRITYSDTLAVRKVCSAFNQLFRLGLSMAEVMESAYLGERLTPSRCGRMDQCVAMGSGVGVMRFTGSACSLAVLECRAELCFVVADLGGTKDTVKILSELRAAFATPSAENVSPLAAYSRTSAC